jgi:hypothetical protein
MAMNDWDFSGAYEQPATWWESMVGAAATVLCGAGAACFGGVLWHASENPAMAGWLLAGGIGCLGLVSVIEWVSEQ